MPPQKKTPASFEEDGGWVNPLPQYPPAKPTDTERKGNYSASEEVAKSVTPASLMAKSVVASQLPSLLASTNT